MNDISLVLDSDSSDDDDNTSVDSNEGMDGSMLTGINVIGTFLMTIVLSSLLSISNTTRIFRAERCGNIHRDRAGVLAWLHGLDDLMFKRQFRLERLDFITFLKNAFLF